MNNFSAIGRVGTQPELKQTAKGDDVASFSVAVDSGYGDKKVTTCFRVGLFGKKTGIVPYINKGDKIAVTGEIVNREYTAKDGSKQQNLEINNANITLIGSKQASDKPVAASNSIDPFEDEMPF